MNTTLQRNFLISAEEMFYGQLFLVQTSDADCLL